MQNPTAKKNHAAIYVVVVSRFARALVPRRSIRARRKAALHGTTIHPPKSHFAPFLPSFLASLPLKGRSLDGWGPLGPHFVFSSLFSTRQASTASMYIVFPRPECFVHAHSFPSYSSLPLRLGRHILAWQRSMPLGKTKRIEGASRNGLFPLFPTCSNFRFSSL